MKLKLAALSAAVLMLSGLGLAAPAAAATSSARSAAVQEAELGAAAASCAANVVIWKTSSTYIQLPTTSGGSLTCEMGQGAKGEHVRALQRALNHCYNAGLDVDTIFGPKTYSALWSAQSQAGAGVDGIYGPETRDAIKWPRLDKGGYFTGYCAKR